MIRPINSLNLHYNSFAFKNNNLGQTDVVRSNIVQNDTFASDYYENKIRLDEERNELLKSGFLSTGCFMLGGIVTLFFMTYVSAAKKGGAGRASAHRETMLREFKSLANDTNIPVLDKCKSLNSKLKDFLTQMANYQNAGSDLAEEAGAKAANRLIISGPPGSGKSYFAKVYAKTLGADYMEIKIPDIISQWAGEGVQNIRNIFDNIITEAEKNTNKKFVVTLNEIDAYIQPVEGYARGSKGSHWITKMEERGTFLDYIEELQEKVPNVTIIGTTNISPRKNGLDGAAVSRFQNVIEVNLPKSDMFEEALKMNIEKFKGGDKFIKSNEKNIKSLAEDMEKNGYSFRDMDNLIEKSRRYYLGDKVKDKNAEYKFSHLENAFKTHGITDGDIAA